MDVAALLLDLYGRIPSLVRHAVDGLDADQLTQRPSPDANPIGWLIWHLARIQDDHVADLLGADQIWVGGDWARRFRLDAEPSNTGYGHSAQEVAAVQPEGAAVLVDYFTAVHERTQAMLRDLTPADLDRVVDRRWDPPVTLGVRLVSVASDDLQHAAQAAYVRGLLGL